MKKVKIDAQPNQLLHMQNGYKIAAATWVIDMIHKHKNEYTAHLNSTESAKVHKEMGKISDGLRNKREKLHK